MLIGIASAQIVQTTSDPAIFYDQPEVLKKAGVKKVRCLFKDSRQLIWIGTENGLFRYDGTNVTYQYHQDGNKSSIPNNTIVNIAEDKKGNIWIGTLGGIGRINPYNTSCETYREILNNLTGDYDNKILIDDEGCIWAANTKGIQLFDTKKNRFYQVWNDEIQNKKNSAYVTSFIQFNKDSLVIGTFTDIVMLNKRNYHFRRIMPFNADITVNQLFMDQARHLWIGTWSAGCLISDSLLNHFTSYKWRKDADDKNSNIAKGFVETNQENVHSIWINTEIGII